MISTFTTTRRKAGNRLSHWMIRRKVSVDDLVKRCVDANATAIAMMEQDRALPTRRDLRIIAQTLDVAATDIWAREKLDLLGLLVDKDDSRKDHAGQERFRVWMLPEEKAKLEKAINALGYTNPTSWFREMADWTVKAAEKKGVY